MLSPQRTDYPSHSKHVLSCHARHHIAPDPWCLRIHLWYTCIRPEACKQTHTHTHAPPYAHPHKEVVRCAPFCLASDNTSCEYWIRWRELIGCQKAERNRTWVVITISICNIIFFIASRAHKRLFTGATASPICRQTRLSLFMKAL